MINYRLPISAYAHRPLQQRGLTLVEVLVAVLVLSIGLLGLAALQGTSLQSSQAAYFRTQAINAAYEIADFTRANQAWALEHCRVPDMGTAEETVSSQLPGGQVNARFANEVNCSDGKIIIEVSWQEERLQDADGEEKIVFETRI